MKQTLFVGGCPRSGTTILGDILNCHPDICLGEERYGHVFAKDFPNDAFQEERFLSFEPGDTFYSSFEDVRTTRAEVRRKFERARIVGDKIPKIYEHMNKMREIFDRPKFVMIVRNIHDVAVSYQTRAHDPSDLSWSLDNDFAVGVSEWNDSLYAIKEFTTPEDTLVVGFEELFLTGTGLFPIRRFLGIDDWAECNERYEQYVDHARRTDVERNRRLPAREAKYVLLNAHIEDYRIVCKMIEEANK